MRVLITGNQGYIGSVLGRVLREAGHECVGVDAGYFAGCTVAPADDIPTIRADVRTLGRTHLKDFDAIVHLAGLSNDPLGHLDARLTLRVNLEGGMSLAREARRAGVSLFVFSSSCSIYGASGGETVDESAPLEPLTPYAETKARFEQGIAALAGQGFSPVILRNATVHGWSPRLRGDLVVHHLLASALTTGRVLVKSDGTPWRPLVHIQDVAHAFRAVLQTPLERVHGTVLNVGSNSENYQVSEMARIVASIVPGSEVEYAPGGEPDKRDYRVDFSRIGKVLPGFTPSWTLERSIRDLYVKFQRHGIDLATITSPTCDRLGQIRSLIQRREVDSDLRWNGHGTVNMRVDDAAVS